MFLSTLSLRRATVLKWQVVPPCYNFYPRSPCGERPLLISSARLDSVFLSTLSLRRATSGPHSPRPQSAFLSTLSLRRATMGGEDLRDFLVFLSTLSLRRATVADVGVAAGLGISIHALLAESDKFGFTHMAQELNFYPRSPCGERHPPLPAWAVAHIISIHALLAESDLTT